jgi:hypothetical protein
MTKILVPTAASLSVGLAGLALIALTVAVPKKVDSIREARNLATVQTVVALCARSRCEVCGTFRYNLQDEVEYSWSLCEMNFKEKEHLEQLAEEDRQIRSKYDAGR